MKLPAYSSLAAFIAHYQALKRAGRLSSDEHELLAEMTRTLEALTPADREVIEAGRDGDRHVERARRKLQHVLLTRGALSG